MRFTTEFEREILVIPDAEFISNVPHVSKLRGQCELGEMISNVFGWKENTVKMYGGKEMNRWSLEIEAFPMDKWVEFKQRLLLYIERSGGDAIHSLQIIKDLESVGKPSGAAKEKP
jgi:hypothetical protein